MSANPDPIHSAAHPLLKQARAAASGDVAGVLFLEGDRLVDEARRQGLAFEAVLVAEERGERLAELRAAGLPVRAVRGELLARVSTLTNSPGCLALVRAPRMRTLAELPAASEAKLAVAAGIQDPGNLGALARTAEAAGAAALLVTRGGCSPWNPKVLRGSMGSVLRLPVLEIEPSPAAAYTLEQRGFRNVCARTRGGESHDSFDWSGRVALWFSGEGGGFPGELARASERFAGVTIPMNGAVESLNVTVAAAVLLFSACRARAGK